MNKKKVIGVVALIAVFTFASVFIGNIRSDKLQELRDDESQDNKLELEKEISSVPFSDNSGDIEIETESQDNKLELEKEISSVPFSDEIDDTSEIQSESEDNKLDLKKEIYDKSMVE